MVEVFGNVHDCLLLAPTIRKTPTPLNFLSKKSAHFHFLTYPSTMSVSGALSKVQKLVSLEASGNKDAHADLLKAIRELQLAAETPLETTSRVNFQVSTRRTAWWHSF